MALRHRPSTPSTPRTRAEQRTEEREFWERDVAGNSAEPRKAAFAETVTSYRRWLRARRRP